MLDHSLDRLLRYVCATFARRGGQRERGPTHSMDTSAGILAQRASAVCMAAGMRHLLAHACAACRTNLASALAFDADNASIGRMTLRAALDRYWPRVARRLEWRQEQGGVGFAVVLLGAPAAHARRCGEVWHWHKPRGTRATQPAARTPRGLVAIHRCRGYSDATAAMNGTRPRDAARM
jgi:hypothetical protein